MMSENRTHFTPQEVDQQIDRMMHGNQERDTDSTFLRELQQACKSFERSTPQHQQILERGLQRLQTERIQPANNITYINTHAQRERSQRGPSQQRPLQRIVRPLTSLVAGLVVAAIVGSMLVLFITAKNGSLLGGQLPQTPGHTVRTFDTSQNGKYWSDSVYHLSWSPDSKRLLSTNSTVLAWDATTGKNIVKYPVAMDGGATLIAQWSPNGKQIAIAGTAITVLDAVSQKVITTIKSPEPASSSGGSGGVHNAMPARPASGGTTILSMAWSPDSRYIVATTPVNYNDNTVYVWSAHTGKMVTKYTGHKEDVWEVAWSPDGKYIASSGREKAVYVWEPLTGKTIYTFIKTEGNSYGLAWSPDSTRIASGSDTKTLVWDAFTGEHIVSLASNSVSSLAWSPDGKRLVTAGVAVSIWNTSNGEQQYSYDGHHGTYVRSVSWSPDGRYIATGENYGEAGGKPEVKVWTAG